jgi:hypothetical protein
MSLIGTVANYGGKQPSNTQNIKQFVIGNQSTVNWIYKKISNKQTVETPADKTKAVLIDNDLYVSGSIYKSSDKNLKKNIIKIDNNKIDSIINLEPVEFIFKEDINEKKHFGLIAQDIEIIYPELVIEENGKKSVNYIELIPLLLSKIKKQEIEMNELREKMNAIINKLN